MYLLESFSKTTVEFSAANFHVQLKYAKSNGPGGKAREETFTAYVVAHSAGLPSLLARKYWYMCGRNGTQ
jgi:hypothetical protein